MVMAANWHRKIFEFIFASTYIYCCSNDDVQVVPNINRDRLQLIGVAAMFIAAKYEEVYVPDVSDFVFVTDNTYTKENVFQCEREILSKLGFCLARPIPLSFLRRWVLFDYGYHRYSAYVNLIPYIMPE